MFRPALLVTQSSIPRSLAFSQANLISECRRIVAFAALFVVPTLPRRLNFPEGLLLQLSRSIQQHKTKASLD